MLFVATGWMPGYGRSVCLFVSAAFRTHAPIMEDEAALYDEATCLIRSLMLATRDRAQHAG